MIKKLAFSFIALFLTGNVALASSPPPACPTILMTGTDVSCYGNSDGNVTISIISGGSGDYTYTWSDGTINSGASGSMISSKPVGTYTVTIKDNVSGCTVTGAFVVGSPEAITISQVITDVNCYNAATGGIDITVQGGTTPYVYNWSNGTTSQDLTNVQAGSYTVTVNAPNAACNFSKSFTIGQPVEALDGSGVVTDVSCFSASTGSIDVTVWGGTPPYAYSWDSGQTSQDITGVSAGSYQLTVTDVKGCVNILPFVVGQPTALGGSIAATPVICNGDPTGTVTYTATGGTLPYSYSWQNSTTLFAQNQAAIYNMYAEDYQVTVTDGKGCTVIGNITVSEPTELVGSSTAVNVSCYGGNDGSIDLTINGGVAPYDVVWTDGIPTNIGNTDDLNTLFAQVYTASITDFNGCTTSVIQEVTQPNLPVSVSTEVVDVLCFGNNTGSIELEVSGGTLPYTYVWSNGATTEDVYDLLAGSYDYDVLDANNCPFSGTEVVSQPLMPLTVTNVITDVNCFGESNGVIDLTVTGGTAPYSFYWTNSTYQLSTTTEDLVNYVQDSYRYEVTDANGCIEFDTLTIAEPTELVSDVVGVDILCFDGDNGSVDLTVAGGTIPYVFLWNTGAVTEDINTLIAGYYEVLVTDGHGCTLIDSITLTQPSDSLDFTYEVVDVLCNDGVDGEIELSITGGTMPYNYNWSSGDTVDHIIDLTAGFYEFLVTDNNGCIKTDSIFVDQPEAVTLNEDITPVTCFGLSDGIIDITPIGGTMPYGFTWYNSAFALSAQTEDLANWPADVYQLEIIDSNNCFYEMFLEIVEPDLLEIEYTYNVVSCAGGIDGNILVDITGGNPAYSTTWSNGDLTEDLLNIPADVYQLIVVDTKGCTDSILVDVAQPDSIQIDFDVDEVSCIDNYDGVAYANPSGGNGGYFYAWSNGTDDYINSGLSNETYTLTVTDLLGCIGEDTVYIPKNGIGCIDPVNAFSPNFDDYNDTWVIDNMGLYPDAQVQIFNKWGTLIHEQTGVYEPWNGKTKGAELPADTFYWIINLNHPDREILKGNITIVR